MRERVSLSSFSLNPDFSLWNWTFSLYFLSLEFSLSRIFLSLDGFLSLKLFPLGLA